MATKRLKIEVTDPQFFADAQYKRESVRVWQARPSLPLYIEEWDAQNNKGKVWVKVPKIPAGGSVDLYLYYGNANAQSSSNGEAVFDFFDDFEGDSLDTSKWKVTTGGSYSYSVSNSILSIHTASGNNNKVILASNGRTFDFPTVAEMKAKITGPYLLRLQFSSNDVDPGQEPQIYLQLSYYSGYPITLVSVDASGNLVSQGGGYAGSGVWYNVVLKTDGYNTVGCTNSDCLSVTQSNDFSAYIMLYQVSAYDKAMDSQIDWVRVRKYAEQEPTVTVGDEEQSDVQGWLYRRKITITNPNSYDLEDFQVAIDLDGSNFDFAKANSDGSDLRILLDDPSPYAVDYYIESWGYGYNSIPYYISSWDSQDESADIWVRVPNIPANGEAEIYLYYGNPSAVSESDGEAVFEFFDDFEGTELDTSKWDIKSGTPTVSNGICTLQGSTIVGKIAFSPTGYVFTARASMQNDKYAHIGWTAWTDDSWWKNSEAFTREGSSPYKRTRTGKDGAVTDNGTSWADDTFLIWKIVSSEGSVKFYIDGELKTEHTTNIPTVDLYPFFGSERDNPQVKIDWVRVRKYAEQEPSVSVGGEEPSDIPGWLYRRKITITNPNNYDLEDFQVKIHLDSSNFDFSKANSDGSDIRTYASSYLATIWVAIDEHDPDFYIEVNPTYTTDESNQSVMNLPEDVTHFGLKVFRREVA